MTAALAAWILVLMTYLAPSAPWKDTYAGTAAVIAQTSASSPLFEGRLGSLKTAVLYVALAWFESSLRPDAEGDCTDDKTHKAVASIGGRCPAGATPHSFCLFQVSETNFASLGVSREQVQSSVDVCTDSASKMAHASFAICRTAGRPLDERLGNYAYGRGTCGGPKGEGLSESRHRMTKATWLFKNHGPPQTLLDLLP